jgi:hypothetical protein
MACYDDSFTIIFIELTIFNYYENYDRLCSLEVIVSDYRSRGPVSIPGATRFAEK